MSHCNITPCIIMKLGIDNCVPLWCDSPVIHAISTCTSSFCSKTDWANNWMRWNEVWVTLPQFNEENTALWEQTPFIKLQESCSPGRNSHSNDKEVEIGHLVGLKKWGEIKLQTELWKDYVFILSNSFFTGHTEN